MIDERRKELAFAPCFGYKRRLLPICYENNNLLNRFHSGVRRYLFTSGQAASANADAQCYAITVAQSLSNPEPAFRCIGRERQ